MFAGMLTDRHSGSFVYNERTGEAVPGTPHPYQQGAVPNTIQYGFEPGLRRPFWGEKGRFANKPCVVVNTGQWTIEKGERVPIRRCHVISDLVNNGQAPAMVLNATALRKEEWIELDRVVERAARFRLRAYADLAAANSYGGFNGMSKMVLEHEAMSDPGEAVQDMNGLTPSRTDAPLFQLRGTPLPITHVDFWFDARRLSISRNTGMPLDSTMGEAAGRRIAETLEKVTIGVETGMTYGGQMTQYGGYDIASTAFGYINFPKRLTFTTLRRPTTVGVTREDIVEDVLSCIDELKLHKFYGPYMLYTSNDWDFFMDGDYTLAASPGVTTQTLRERLRKIDGILDVRRLDFLQAAPDPTQVGSPARSETHPFTLVFVQMTADVARAVNGMDITTLQWETKGGMQLNFKVMCIQVAQLRSDYYYNTGILHAYKAA